MICEGVDWIQLAEGKDLWWAVVIMVEAVNLQDP